jgi:hypothetical protein
MSINANKYEIVIKNKRIWEFYHENTGVDIETANIMLIEFMENIFNEMSNDIDANINAQLLSYMKDSKNQIDNLKQTIAIMSDNISKMNSDMTNNMVLQFVNLKKDYIDDVRQVIHNSSLTTNEKLAALMDKNNSHLIDKTSLILNDIIPKNQEQLNTQIQSNIKQLHLLIAEDTAKLAKNINSDKSLQEFVSNFETKYNSMLQTIQQPLYSFFTATENRLTQNIDSLKETTSNSLSSQTKLQEELQEFLGKYNVSSNKGKYGEQNLCNILNSIYQTADIRDTTGVKSSGDFIMERPDRPTILFENKDYKQNINKEEIAKFIIDVDNQNTHGIFLSQYSGIAFKQNYQIDIHKGKILVYVQNCEYSIDKIRIAVDIIDNLSVKIEDLTQDDDTNSISKELLDSINEEYQKCISQKEAAIVLLKDFSKKMTAQIEDIKFPELDKYLSQKYAYVKSSFFSCDLCNNFNASSKQSLSAHKRGCIKKQKSVVPAENIVISPKVSKKS